MNNLKLEILSISDKSFNGDAILYIYLDNELKDAVTITKDFRKPPTANLEFSSESTIQITSKDLNQGVYLGTCTFLSSLLLDNPSGITVPLNTSSVITKLENFSEPSLKLALIESEKPVISPKDRNDLRESDIVRAVQSELDLEKWKNTGLKQVREEMNSSELARVSVMQKFCKTVEKYQNEIRELKKQIKIPINPPSKSLETINLISDILKHNKEEWLLKENNYKNQVSFLVLEKEKKELEIQRLKKENQKTREKISCLKVEEQSQANLDLIEKKEMLEQKLGSLKIDVELNKSNLNEAIEQINNFQSNNTKLRSYIEVLEEKTEKHLKIENFDILSLVNTHLEALSIQATVTQVTKNIFKIDNDSLYLFLVDSELMTYQGPGHVTFVEWLQKNKWQTEEPSFEKKKRLDTVPEEENEDEVQSSPLIEKRKSLKKSPNKNIKEFSPVLKKKHK